MTTNQAQFRKNLRHDRLATGILGGIGAFILILLIVMTVYILYKGFSSFTSDMLTATTDGILNQLWNTVYLVFWSLLFSVPVGIAAGVYLAEYARHNRFTSFLRISIETLSSLPSIVVGLFGYLVFILLTGFHWNLFAGALAVSILCLPLIATETDQAIRSLPSGYKQGSLALGATEAETIFNVLIPSAMPQIITGIIMAAGRGFGESAALLYTAGQSTNLNWSNWDLTSVTCPLNPFRSGETLALHIWVLRTEGSLYANSSEVAWFSSAVLVIMTFLFSYSARHMSNRMRKKQTR